MAMQIDTGRISAIHSILHLIFHRNKNQHSTSKWWKWLSILKRSTLRLLGALEYLPPYNKSSSSVDIYKEYLAKHVIPRCSLAFSAVVADGQFSTLGIVILTVLADLASAIQIDFDLTSISRQGGRVSKHSRDIEPAVEDIGEAVCREKNTPALAKGTELTSQGKITTGSARTSSESKSDVEGNAEVTKKKSRKKNTIDELFSNFF